jgi:hypothetical protein
MLNDDVTSIIVPYILFNDVEDYYKLQLINKSFQKWIIKTHDVNDKTYDEIFYSKWYFSNDYDFDKYDYYDDKYTYFELYKHIIAKEPDKLVKYKNNKQKNYFVLKYEYKEEYNYESQIMITARNFQEAVVNCLRYGDDGTYNFDGELNDYIFDVIKRDTQFNAKHILDYITKRMKTHRDCSRNRDFGDDDEPDSEHGGTYMYLHVLGRIDHKISSLKIIELLNI